MLTPISSAAFQTTMEAAGYRVRRPGVVSSFNAPCPEKRGFCLAVWHDDTVAAPPENPTVIKSSFQIVGDLPMATVTHWYLERDYGDRCRFELELVIYGGLSPDYLRGRMITFGELLASHIAPDLHRAFGSWSTSSQPASERLAARLTSDAARASRIPTVSNF
ncbi:hypothetical protein Ga0100231_012195 [Opitutaceae bacterium TAV4]|nr:hypothetical protein Ga0100231_012195 [Opitutaceae bacterium TAV4]RRK02102.1 hypothetical protein Ga0100230_002555 [Opitutaceae bacterium TAV3]